MMLICIFTNITNVSALNEDVKLRQSEKFRSLPSYLKTGDLIFCDIKPCFAKIFGGIVSSRIIPGNSNDHVAMYIGRNKIIHSMPGGVKIVPFWTMKIWAENIAFANVKNALEQDRINAVKWAKTRLFRLYQHDWYWPSNFNPKDKDDKYSDFWTCAELVWAAYWNQGIKIINENFSQTHSFLITSANYLLSDENITTYENIPPTAIIDIGLNMHDDPNIVEFSSWASTDTDGKKDGWRELELEYRWNYNNNGTWTNWTDDHMGQYRYETVGKHSIRLQVRDSHNATDETERSFTIVDNHRPNKVDTPVGTIKAKTGEECVYSFSSTDLDDDPLYFQVFFSDSTPSKWLGPYSSNETVEIKYKWKINGEHFVIFRVKDEHDSRTRWSDVLSVTITKNDLSNSYIFKNFIEKHPCIELILSSKISK
jgi:uncharacterized protein YycO